MYGKTWYKYYCSFFHYASTHQISIYIVNDSEMRLVLGIYAQEMLLINNLCITSPHIKYVGILPWEIILAL